MKEPNTIADFLDQIEVVPETGCAQWMGKSVRGKYGHFLYEGKRWTACRFAWTLSGGTIPKGFVIFNKCRNTLCCNVDHMEVVRKRETMLRGETVAAKNSKAEHCPKGHPYSEANTKMKQGRHGPYRRCRICIAEGKRRLRELHRCSPVLATNTHEKRRGKE